MRVVEMVARVARSPSPVEEADAGAGDGLDVAGAGESGGWVEDFADAVVAGVGDVDVAGGVGPDAAGSFEEGAGGRASVACGIGCVDGGAAGAGDQIHLAVGDTTTS